ncbi:MAG: hypothetical protein WCH79_20045 [Planctomycetia bacterium]
MILAPYAFHAPMANPAAAWRFLRICPLPIPVARARGWYLGALDERRSIPKEVDMKILIAMATIVVVLAGPAHAGPFRRRSATTTTRPTTSMTIPGGTGSTATVRTGASGGAQGHAESMAASCSMVHAASHGNTYEGVGVGGSPSAALASCCNNGGAVIEEGTAQGRDGRWYACRRYSR